MTQETLDRAKTNRKERAEKLQQYNNVSWKHDNLPDEKVIWLDACGIYGDSLYPTNEEYKSLLRTMRDRLDAEIAALDKEFEKL